MTVAKCQFLLYIFIGFLLLFHRYDCECKVWHIASGLKVNLMGRKTRVGHILDGILQYISPNNQRSVLLPIKYPGGT